MELTRRALLNIWQFSFVVVSAAWFIQAANFSCFSGGGFLGMSGKGKDSCSVCSNRVAKSAKALQCMLCREWFHCTCAGLEEDDYVFMSKRFRYGFRWSCDECGSEVDSLMAEGRMTGRVDRLMQDVTSMISEKMGDVTGRLGDLERKFGLGEDSSDGVVREESSFAGIVKKAVKEVTEKKTSVTVKDHGSSKIVVDQNVMLVNPAQNVSDSDEVSKSLNQVKQSLQNSGIPVTSCQSRKAGGLVVKFPSKEALEKATSTVASSLGDDPVLRVSEPKKALPKMTIPNIPKAMSDEDILDSILRKNANIKRLVDRGHAFSVLLTLKREDTKTAVVKLAPEIRSEIVSSGSRVFVGLTRCRVYDRVWVRQCYHCQGFSHIAENCSKKEQDPVCVYCAGSHRSKDCTNKSNPKCINCKTAKNQGAHNHFASSVDCPIMILQRQRVIDNTNYVSSKN